MGPNIDRRTTLKWMLAAAAAPALALPGCDSDPAPPAPSAGASPTPDPTPAQGAGYGTDPNLVRTYAPGELWPLTLTEAQRGTAAVLSALILPADADGPGAVEVGVVAFIDEWVSAPYPMQRRDRALILDGFAWLDAEAQRRFGRGSFAVLDATQQAAICDDICYLPKASAEHQQAAAFFARYRDLTASGFCTSPQGRTYLRYVGNTPMARFDGPPPEVLERVGLS
ncbi:MAG TPA: gluconate 2-dehydrogenase subunit 3 family protein [Xanthomonadaceae bacterium]|nr:gluconate 2-dehydrogenase subunit 3 family protein [Xanthomonadaceae bacterium]